MLTDLFINGNAPTKGAVLLFLLVSMLTVILSAGSAIFSAYTANQYIGTSNHQWCAYLEHVTQTKPPVPTNPKTQPGRVYEYELYQDFIQLSVDFGCK